MDGWRDRERETARGMKEWTNGEDGCKEKRAMKCEGEEGKGKKQSKEREKQTEKTMVG